jgi:hypothetical protein
MAPSYSFANSAVLKTAVFNAMPLVYFDLAFCPFDPKRGNYPGLN